MQPNDTKNALKKGTNEVPICLIWMGNI